MLQQQQQQEQEQRFYNTDIRIDAETSIPHLEYRGRPRDIPRLLRASTKSGFIANAFS